MLLISSFNCGGKFKINYSTHHLILTSTKFGIFDDRGQASSFSFYRNPKAIMNFLSHFYFTQHKQDPYFTLGSVLPDLLRNYNGLWRINPEKIADKLNTSPELISLLKGWKLHVFVDKSFHSSPYFKDETSSLRKKLAPIFTRLPIRPFFLAHVGYELTLDSLLIQNKLIKTDEFYQEIRRCKPSLINEFLLQSGIKEPAGFFPFLDSFIKSNYLDSYEESRNIVYALDRIGRRVWNEKFNDDETNKSIAVFENLKESLNPSFIEVFQSIEETLKE